VWIYKPQRLRYIPRSPTWRQLNSHPTSLHAPRSWPYWYASIPFLVTDKHSPALDALFWDTISSMDVASTQGLSTIAALVHSPSSIICARCLRGDQAQTLADKLDQASDSGRRSSVPRVTMRHSFSRCHTLMREYLGGPHSYFTRSAKPAGCCPPHISFNQSTLMLVNLGGEAALQT